MIVIHARDSASRSSIGSRRNADSFSAVASDGGSELCRKSGRQWPGAQSSYCFDRTDWSDMSYCSDSDGAGIVFGSAVVSGGTP